MAKKINQTTVSVQVEIQGKVVTFTKEVANHELEEATAAILNSVLLLESNLNEWCNMRCRECDSCEVLLTETSASVTIVMCLDCGITYSEITQ